MAKDNFNCPKCKGKSILPEYMFNLGWTGPKSVCPVCGGMNIWVTNPPDWDDDFEKIEAMKEADKIRVEEMKRGIL